MRKNKKKLEMLMTVLILTASFYVGRLGATIVGNGRTQNTKKETGAESGEQAEAERSSAEQTTAEQAAERGEVIVIDAGHGGVDAGKVGNNGILEKEINLQIAGMLQEMLEEEGFDTVMTRESDAGLYDEGEPNKKQQDMKRRCALINEADPLMAVSIHQNSYTDAAVKGPQVFYYESSEKGSEIAKVLQDALNGGLSVEKPRAAKANSSYYLLRKTKSPTVIVECGFLSNPQEAGLLITQEYQEKVARAVCDGILEYALSCASLTITEND